MRLFGIWCQAVPYSQDSPNFCQSYPLNCPWGRLEVNITMTHIEETDLKNDSKILDYLALGFGLALLPVVFVVAPRFAINSFREGNAVSVKTPANAEMFAANRIYSDTDTERVKAMTQMLKSHLDADDWTGLSEQLRDIDHSRTKLEQHRDRLADIALDFIRHELSEAVYAPTMCNFESYYEVADETVLKRVEEALHANPSDPYLTALLAQLYIDRGWCARGGGWSHEVTEEGWRELMSSFDKARALLARFDPREIRSPFYARVKFQLMVTEEAENGLDHARDAYQDWSDMDISNPLPHRQFAFFALPRWFGDWDSFDVEARRAADRTRTISGKAAYADFYLQALGYDEDDCLINLDPQYFAEAIHDLIRNDVNPAVRAQKLAVQLKEHVNVEPISIIGEVLSYSRQKKRKALKPLVREILETHVTHLGSEEGSAFEAAVLGVISDAFQRELKAGQDLSFTPEGIRMVAPQSDA